MAGIGIKRTGPGHILRNDGHTRTTGVPVGQGEYTCEAVMDGLILADQAAVDAYAQARGFAAGEFTFVTI